jgi:glycosyltransferase involved in cell wall biosynthesis
MMKKTILVSAYACDVNTPSEPIAGWAFLMAVANTLPDDAELHVLTRGILRETIEKNFPVKYRGRVLFHFIQIPKFLKILEEPGLGLKARLGYLVWNYFSKIYLKRQSWLEYLDVAYHFTLSTEILPTPLTVVPKSALKIWGPVGSAGNAKIFLLPPANLRNFLEAFKQTFRGLLSRSVGRLNGRCMDLILCQTKYTTNLFKSFGMHTLYFPNHIFEAERVDGDLSPTSEKIWRTLGENEKFVSSIKIAMVGHILPNKRNDIAFNFIERQSKLGNKYSLVVIGADPKKSRRTFRNRSFMNSSDENSLHFVGKLRRDHVAQLLAKMDILLHTSGREGSSFVVGEAISLGIPVVCFEGTGAADIVRSVSKSGVIIPVSRNSLRNLSESIEEAVELKSSPRNIWNNSRIESLIYKLNRRDYI